MEIAMLEGRNAAERVTLQMLLRNAVLRKYIYLDQAVIDLFFFQRKPGDPHIHAPCGTI